MDFIEFHQKFLNRISRIRKASAATYFSALAVIFSGISLYAQFIYESNDFKVYISNITVADGKINYQFTFINDGTENQAITGCSLSLQSKGMKDAGLGHHSFEKKAPRCLPLGVLLPPDSIKVIEVSKKLPDTFLSLDKKRAYFYEVNGFEVPELTKTVDFFVRLESLSSSGEFYSSLIKLATGKMVDTRGSKILGNHIYFKYPRSIYELNREYDDLALASKTNGFDIDYILMWGDDENILKSFNAKNPQNNISPLERLFNTGGVND